MSYRRVDSIMGILLGAIYLFGAGFIAVFATIVMVRFSMYYFVFLFVAAAMYGMALWGAWMLRTEIVALMSGDEEEGEAGKGQKRRRARPVRPGKRPRRSPGSKSGLAGGPA